MIIRMWRGKVRIEKAEAYKELMKSIAIPDYSSVEGFISCHFTTSQKEDHVEFLLITYWQTLEAIIQFAGKNYQQAKYYEEDKEYLLEFPEEVEHFEIFASANSNLT